MIKADLHCHSTVSDGSDTVAELARKAKEIGLDVLAITEHDTLSHRKYIDGVNFSIDVYCAIEISAYEPETGKKAHVLGYGIIDCEKVEAFTLKVLEDRHQNSLKQIEILDLF